MSRLLRSALLFSAIALLAGNTINATTYTSAQSGNFISASTWVGGIVPPAVLNQQDTIHIVTGHDVTMNNNQALVAPNSLLKVDGILRGPQYALFLGLNVDAEISGSVIIDSLATATNDLNVTGQITARTAYIQNVNATGSGSITVTQTSQVAGNFVNTGGNTFVTGSGSTIYMQGGSFTATGTGILDFTNTYDVVYRTNAAGTTTGPELSGSGLQHVTVNLPAATDELSLGDNVDIANGNLTLSTGLLNLNSNTLIFSNNGNLAATGSGMLKSAQLSSVTIANNTGLSGELTFVTGGNTLSTLTLNPTNGATTTLGSPLRITGKVEFMNGKLDLDAYKLSLITGATVSGADADKYFITSGVGVLSSDIGSGNSFTYHIGTPAQYAPCTITSKNNTVYNGLGMRIAPGVVNLAANQPKVNATWFFESNSGTVDVDATPMWGDGMEANQFDRSKAYVSMFRVHYWDKLPGKAATTGSNGLHSLTRTGINEFTPLSVFDNNTVDVQNIETKETITLYPNPVGNELHIGNLTQAAQVTIYNTAGAVVINQHADKNNNTISTASLPAGIYFVQLKGEGVDASGRITKQ